MEKAGLVTRKRDTKDERIMRIHLTDHGRALRERARAIPPAMLCASGLELEGLMALREEVKALNRNLRENSRKRRLVSPFQLSYKCRQQ